MKVASGYACRGGMAIESKDDNVFRFVHLRGLSPGGQQPPGPPGGQVPPAEEPEAPEETMREASEEAFVERVVAGLGAEVVNETDAESFRAGDSSSGLSNDIRLSNASARDARSSPATLLAAAVTAKRELEMLRPGKDLVLPNKDGTVPLQSSLLAVTESGAGRLSEATISLLGSLEPDGIVGASVTTLIATLDQVISSRHLREVQTKPTVPPPLEVPKIKSVGVAELLVVKQQITRYEPTEIAHIENVLAGESKVRRHRKLDRIEEETVSFSEEVVTQERELEATERFELNKETTTTAQRDQKRGFGLTLSGRYGPTVEFSSELNLQDATSSAEATRNAVNYAKDVIERSRESIVTTVREERRRRVLREVEEVNRHSVNNDTGTHISGVYQFLDKVYTSQVFDYGLREMFDFLVPEPASYLVHLNSTPRSDIELPVPPVDLNAYVADASGIDEGNYLDLGARYNVEGLIPPPPAWLMRRQGATHGQGDVTEEGRPRSFEKMEIDIPQGYRAIFAEISSVLTSDDIPTLILTVGNQIIVVPKSDMTEVDLQQGSFKAYTKTQVVVFPNEDSDYVAQEKLTINAFANESANYVVKAKVHFWRDEPPLSWKIKTYDMIAEAYRNLRLQYEQDVEEIRARAEQEFTGTDDFGSPPERNLRMIRGELKKHCLAVLRRTHDNVLSTTHVGGTDAADPPLFDIAEAMTDGREIRFLETAFEWDQVQYAFYPYFWARASEWSDRFHVRNLDPAFEEFLRAGSARVVVPVRPGLEAAVAHFLETSEVWNGEGEPTVNDPLYKPIVEEIRERTGAGKGEIAVGTPWETRIPTAAVKLRKDDALPEWELVAGTDWEWEPKP